MLVIFQGRQEDLPTYEETREIAIPDGDWFGKRNFSGRSIAIGARDKPQRRMRRCAGSHGGPLPDSLGVSLGTGGPMKFFRVTGWT